MQICSTYNINQLQNNKINFQSQVQLQKAGILKQETSRMIEDFLHAYREIKVIIERKTPEGIKKIMDEFPNITIGENLVFHNCGEDKNSIHVKIAQSEKYRGLTYISRREGNTEWSKRIFLESFMFSDTSKLISNFNQTHSKSFPETLEFLSEDEILKTNSNEKIIKLLNDLDPILLSFRKYLAKNLDRDLKLPDGEINYNFIYEVKNAIKTCKESIENSKRLSNKRRLKMNQEFTDLKPTSGAQTLIFQNLGNEKVTIHLTERTDSQGFNLTQLYIDDSNGNPLKSFLIVDNKKFVSNLNQKNPNTLPDKYTYANVEEVNEKYLPEFKKYFNLYQDKLKEYQKYSNKIIDKTLSVKSIGSFSETSANTLLEAVEWYKNSKIKLKKLPQVIASSIKSRTENLAPAIGRTGLWLNDPEKGKIIIFQPLSSKKHNNLLKISIRNTNSGTHKEFLIHEYKYIVKNYNPQYPTIIPNVLKYASENELEDANIESTFRFIKNKCVELATEADKAFEKKECIAKELYGKKLKESSSNKDKIKKQEFEYTKQIKELKKDCKKIFAEAYDKLNNIMNDFENGILYNEGIENFNKAIAEIINHTKDFYASQKKAKFNQ